MSDAASGRDDLKTVATLGLLTLALPLSLALVAGALVRARTRERPRPAAPPARRRTVLVGGGKMTKALQLARSFHAAGHRVVLFETRKYRLTAHRFSRAVDRFVTVPDSTSAAYVPALVDLVRRERVDVYVPVCSPASSLHDAAAMPELTRHCEVLHVGPERIADLDDKFRFARTAASLGLRAPKSILVTRPEDVLDFDFAAERRRFILKSIAYDAVRRLDLTRLPLATPELTRAFVASLPISPERPWVMQEFIPGIEYCTHGTFRDGELRVHCCCRSSAFQVNYRHDNLPEIEDWVRRFGAGLRLTGQISIDFIRADDDGEVYAIECNPRTHSAITMLYDRPELAAAYLGDPVDALPVTPSPTSRPTYWLAHELTRLARALAAGRGVGERVRILREGKDAVLDARDPLPFLALHHLHVPALLLGALLARRPWLKIDFNIGKLVQPDGD